MFLTDDQFKNVIEYTPLVSIDLVVCNMSGQILVGKRNNRPAKGDWFVPGGRVLKNEALHQAFKRLSLKELGVEFSMSNASFLGVFEHFYDDCFFDEFISTHYVVLAYQLNIDEHSLCLQDEQHCEYRWMDIASLLSSDSVHQNTKRYFERECL
ncbi:GDP-mannose mannosyl hydrolase [Vibrio tritonius]|uniref:GDP-mannose mannosyl hydrolase n=1 Tax=Vibrio tritonius TaxID=1435069 RepID=UPI000837E808|nr:GDP-mannose mannosyl hydrolase [Vibrio tritonius]